MPVPKDAVISALDLLVNRKPPINQIHVSQLREAIEASSHINVSYVIQKLFLAGYNVEDIVFFFKQAGIIKTQDELIGLREKVELYILKHLYSVARGRRH